MITLIDVARAAGVTPGTASRVLNGRGESHRISAATMDRVKSAAKTLGYVPSYHAQALKSQRAGTIGVVFNSGTLLGPSMAWTTSILGGLDQEVRHNGSNVMLISDRHKLEVLEEATLALQRGRVDALVVFDYVLLRYLSQKGAIPLPDDDASPVVVIGQLAAAKHVRVDVDPAPGLREALTTLRDRGHSQVAWMTPAGNAPRTAVVEALVAELGMHLEVVTFAKARSEHVEVTIAAAYAATTASAPTTKQASAFLCYNDEVALGVLAGLRDQGRRPGHDVAVIGVDDVLAQTAVPAMSTVRMPLPEMGRLAAQLALGMADDPSTIAAQRGQVRVLPGHFIERASSVSVQPDRH